MRIISAVFSLGMLASLLLVKEAIAMPKVDTETNETKINLDIKEKISFSQGVFLDEKTSLIALAPHGSSGLDLLEKKTPEDNEREKKLARFEAKRKSASYPRGKFTVNASAYTAAADECGKSDGITASGLKVKEKETLACPPQFPFGTKIKIEGMGTYVCQDRGGAIKGNKVDIYMETKKEAFAFGRRNLLAEVIF